MNIVCFGAHPDDAEVFAGGTCVKWVIISLVIWLKSNMSTKLSVR